MFRHASPVSGIAVDPHSARVATAGYDNAVVLWTDKGDLVGVGTHDHLANQCEFSSDGAWLVSAGSDRSARIWQVPSMRLVDVVSDHDDDVEVAAFHATGRFVATASRDTMVRVFDRRTRQSLVMSGHTKDATSVAWLDARRVVSTSDDGTVRVWDTTGAPAAIIDSGNVQVDVAICASPDRVIVGNDAGQICVVDARTLTQLSARTAHASGIKRLAYDPASRSIASSGYDGYVRTWGLTPDGRLFAKHEARMPPTIWARSIAFRGERQIVAGTFCGKFASLDIASGQWSGAEPQAARGINSVCIHDGAIATVGDAGIVRLNNTPIKHLGAACNFIATSDIGLVAGSHAGELRHIETGRLIYSHDVPLNCAVTVGKLFVVGTYGGDLVVLEYSGGEMHFRTCFAVHDNAIKGLAVSSGCVFAVCADGTACVVDPDTTTITRCEAHHGGIANAVTTHGDVVHSVGRDRRMMTWRGHRLMSASTTPHEYSIKSIACCEATDVIVTGDYGGVLVARQGSMWSQSVRPTRTGISSLARVAPGIFVATAFDGGVYDIKVGRALSLEVSSRHAA